MTNTTPATWTTPELKKGTISDQTSFNINPGLDGFTFS